ncbi:hypothetical protein ANN_00813 [Periplaneta americana]|uniref:Uncharacterized protein n=1 Tax=Periplaneta americana TaxID=6978 RepID=A0ABQ8TRZ7_PERAM|nr:hypothetical protein ANN_00813 [Periplaneta americana]
MEDTEKIDKILNTRYDYRRQSVLMLYRPTYIQSEPITGDRTSRSLETVTFTVRPPPPPALAAHLNAIDLARDRTRNLGLYQLANQVDQALDTFPVIIRSFNIAVAIAATFLEVTPVLSLTLTSADKASTPFRQHFSISSSFPGFPRTPPAGDARKELVSGRVGLPVRNIGPHSCEYRDSLFEAIYRFSYNTQVRLSLRETKEIPLSPWEFFSVLRSMPFVNMLLYLAASYIGLKIVLPECLFLNQETWRSRGRDPKEKGCQSRGYYVKSGPYEPITMEFSIFRPKSATDGQHSIDVIAKMTASPKWPLRYVARESGISRESVPRILKSVRFRSTNYSIHTQCKMRIR